MFGKVSISLSVPQTAVFFSFGSIRLVILMSVDVGPKVSSLTAVSNSIESSFVKTIIFPPISLTILIIPKYKSMGYLKSDRRHYDFRYKTR